MTTKAGAVREPEVKRLRSGQSYAADGSEIPVYSEYVLKTDYNALAARLAAAQGEVRRLVEANEHWHIRITQEKELREQAESALRDARNAARWIPVSERLPEEDCEVLVFSSVAGRQRITFDTWGEQYEQPVMFSSHTVPVGKGWSDHEFEQVTHWMPLPKSPDPKERA